MKDMLVKLYLSYNFWPMFSKKVFFFKKPQSAWLDRMTLVSVIQTNTDKSATFPHNFEFQRSSSN